MKRLLLIIYYSLFIIPCFAQDPNIRSVQCFVGNNEQSDPLMDINGIEPLVLWFDDLDENRPSLNYTIVHCDADWREDGLFINDYLDGFAENPLRDYQLSFQTRVDYMHYRLAIPNEDVRLKASGNYLLKIYTTDPARPLLVQRFSLYERRTAIHLTIRGPISTGEKCLQQLEFTVQHPELPVRDASRELKVRVTQNGQPVPGVALPVPSFVDRNEVSYTLATGNWYPGGNEFRYFDTRTLDFGAQGVQQVRYDSRGYPYALLRTDAARDEGPYFFYNEINGKYRIDANRRTDRQIEAEYVATGFTLHTDKLAGRDVYVFGALSAWSLQPWMRMEYNEEAGAYQLNVLLKQGYYNYRYLAVEKNGRIDLNALEGCFAETENYYTVLVYYRSPRDRYDRLVGVQTTGTL